MRELGLPAAASLFTREHDATTVLFDDALADREPQAGPFALGLRSEEGLEHLRRECLGHPGPVIDDVYRYAIEPASGSHQDVAGPSG